MATNRGHVARNILNFLSKHGNYLLSKAVHTYHGELGVSGLREEVEYFADQVGDQAVPRLQNELLEEQKVLHLADKIKGSVRNKLICTVFNDMAKEMQSIVMAGPSAQVYYLVDKYGWKRAEEMVKKLLKS